jgi:hypothetical protein
MKRPVPVESASALIDEKLKKLGDWRGKTLARVRESILEGLAHSSRSQNPHPFGFAQGRL